MVVTADSTYPWVKDRFFVSRARLYVVRKQAYRREGKRCGRQKDMESKGGGSQSDDTHVGIDDTWIMEMVDGAYVFEGCW